MTNFQLIKEKEKTPKGGMKKRLSAQTPQILEDNKKNAMNNFMLKISTTEMKGQIPPQKLPKFT